MPFNGPMQINNLYARRRFLGLSASLVSGALLSGCGGGGGGGSAAAEGGITVVPGAVAEAPPPVVATPAPVAAHPLNLALNLAYLGAAFYGHAAQGAGLTADLTAGIGQAGIATGARSALLSDPAIAEVAAELATDKSAQVAALRNQIGAQAAAQPAMDLSAQPGGAFSVAAQRAGIVPAGSSFDPYANDNQFLLGAFLIEDMVAATYRGLLMAGGEDASALVTESLADAIYHGGLVRTLLEDRARSDTALAATLGKATSFAMPDGSTADAQANILDSEGRVIPFTREAPQVLDMLYLAGSAGGGFLPAGANGV